VKRLGAVFLALSLLTGTPAGAEGRRQAIVSWVIDGDTFQTSDGERVRLLGIDSPEYQPHRRKIDPFGKEASEFAKKTLTGKKVLLEGDVEPKDKYGRTLAYVYLPDGTFVNESIVAQGLAKSRYYKPNGKHREELKAAQKAAKKAKKGIWSLEASSAGRGSS